jgi:hypothetical protein
MIRAYCIIAAAVASVLPSVAQAYPQWQFSSGTSACGQCHYAPVGGGLVRSYARDAVGEELSTWEGDGSFAHGLVELPGWLDLGFDGRGAFLRHDAGSPEGPTTAVFPMQADLSGRVARGAFSLAGIVGVHGRARAVPDRPAMTDRFSPSPTGRLVSREHYVMWRPSARGPYARAGRFYAPYGLRLAEHITYVRRDLGMNLFEENHSLSGGVVYADWEMHATGFLPGALLHQPGSPESGFALMGERRLADMLALGLSGRAGYTEDGRRWQGGLFAKAYLKAMLTLFMMEANIVNWKTSGGATVNQFVGYGGLTVFPVRGLWLGLFCERRQSDLRVQDNATNAVNAQINWFPYPHIETMLIGRLQKAVGQEVSLTMLFQLHYYL